jgi:hypothetical protein
MVSGLDRRTEATEAGADRFVPFDEWPRIHVVLEDVAQRRANSPSSTAEPRASAARG